MAKFVGLSCDGCGKVIPEGKATKYTQRFEGKIVDGERSSDLCDECLERGFGTPESIQETLKPVRRRGKKSDEEADTPEETPTGAAATP